MKYLLLIVLCINLLEASAATPMQEMDSCLEKATSSVQVSDCTQKSFKSAEQNMKSLYQAVLEIQTAVERKRFTAAQAAWLKFRESYCNQFMAASLTGVDKSIVLHRCLAVLTFERNEHFTELLISP